MMHTSGIDMANSDEPAVIDTFINIWEPRSNFNKIQSS